MILKTSETKRKRHRGEKGEGCSLKSKSESSNHLLDICPLLCSARAEEIGLGRLNSQGVAAAGLDTGKAKEVWLQQIILVLLNCWQFPIHLCQHVTQGIELLVFDVLPLWVQDWKIDSTFKKTSKVLDM